MLGLRLPDIENKTWKCKTCGHEKIKIHAVGNPVLLWDLYCIKCLENFLDKNIGKMEVKEC